jgi:2-oxoglutarate dehydrogenase E2 component (dihydrolipoamide succinyltransferase)
VQVGDVIALIEVENGDEGEEANDAVEESKAEIHSTQVEDRDLEIPGIAALHDEEPVSQSAESTISNENRFYSPLVKNIAQQESISQAELDNISGSGAEGRVTKQDVLDYLASRSTGSREEVRPVPSTPAVVSSAKQTPTSTIQVARGMDGDEVIEMDRMRRLIADHMLHSVQTSPHVFSVVEADVTNLVNWRNKIKADFKRREGENITFTPLIIEAITRALKDFPMINVSVDGYNIIRRKHINIGMAAALPTGNLIVPVIKDADQLSLVGLSKSVNDLANRARANQLKPDDTQGGTFTFTNIGAFGNIFGMPIINQPQAAIMAVGTITKKPAVLETEYGDVIAIRHKMYLTMSYDHRVIDGALGGSFVRRVADYLEDWDINRVI